MRFERLRIHGFKTFVDPTDFLIEPGLTGVVGPNGCGKSNLVEALRWVMGENSYKNMRASGMDDVIFSGSGKRPSRNIAEVMLVLRNDERRAPAPFTQSELLEVSRRIEREAGSVYRINGREVRARDVQLLFADASTGARSPSMVRQGQIGELIAAKPTARRMILEEAAGISGLHSRRNEAEIRLRGAETNLARLEDVVREIEQRLDALRRQARHAGRYRALSAEIRRVEAALAALRWVEAEAAVAEADAVHGAALSAVADRQAEQARTATLQAVGAHRLPTLRDEAVAAAAALQRLRLALAESESEERRTRERLVDLERRAAEIRRDRDREAAIVADNDSRLAALADEAEALAVDGEAEAGRAAEAEDLRAAAEAEAGRREADLAAATAAEAGASARRTALVRTRAEAAARRSRLAADVEAIAAERTAVEQRLADDAELAGARVALDEAGSRLAEADEAALAAEAALAEAQAAERSARAPLLEAEREIQRLETEARTLARVLNLETGSLFPPLVDRLTVAKGYEVALGAALGEEVDAPLDETAPAHWASPGPADGDPPLPPGAEPLARQVTGPPVIARRLAQIGVVDRAAGPRLRLMLRPGQRLVSREGDLWRWDGYIAAAEAPTAAAQRLASRNRLVELDAQRDAALARAAGLRTRLTEAQADAARAAEVERAARDAVRGANRGLGEARDRLSRAERSLADVEARGAALAERALRVAADLEETAAAEVAASDALAALPAPDDLVDAVRSSRAALAEARAALAEARSVSEAIARDADLRRRRLDAIARERESWTRREQDARAHLSDLAGRLREVEADHAALVDRPDEIVAARRTLAGRIGEAEAVARTAADALAEAERADAEASRSAAAALAALSEAREARVRAEERLTSAIDRRDGLAAEIRDRFDAPPFALGRMGGLDVDGALPDAVALEAALERLRLDREKLGGVNLQAEEEAGEVEARLDALVHEREDLIEAIRVLRQGIHTLNREARDRLMAAFDVVDGHFRRLFTHLFGGGSAELQLVESDDPLDAGLEILARPPGKKPQTMTLLSGGEQALTALALIFAVFLTNPAPICVLDEVDAPLDDANVERYCDLLDEMARTTDTRFLVITHNPITMARMNRLFGVTMAERGVSQLVSVDLDTAERFREAG
jgi:chromosome segregation protein